MLRPDIFEIVDAARSLGFAWKLFTSGVALDDESAAKLAEREPLNIAVSIHGLEAAHDDLTRAPGSFRAAVRAVERLRSHGARVAVKTCLTRRGLADLDELRRLVGSLGAAHQVSPVIYPAADGRPVPAGLAVADEDLPRYYRGCPGDLSSAYASAAVSSATGFEARPVCGAGRMSLAISAGGDVRPCALVDRVVGNVRRSSLRETWESPAMAYFRGITNADRAGCRGCPEIAHCAYCMGLALAETGDLLGVPPTACRQARALGACMSQA
jgi:radical SAM protein with 4Fe4S-binding SPASM domain